MGDSAMRAGESWGQPSRKERAMNRLIGLVVAGAVLGACVADAGEAPTGKWKTVDDKTGKVVSEVELYDQGGKLYGKIVGLTDPTDAQGKPKTCTKCQGGDKDKP